MERLAPADHAEAIAVFRNQVIGPLVAQALTRGQLKEALVALSRVRFRPPGAPRTRSYSVPTLQRWYYAYRREGVDGLYRERRKDRGRARALSDAERGWLTDLRVEHPTASAELILHVLAERGQLTAGKVSAATVRRLFRERGLDRLTLAFAPKEARQRWVARYPGALWQGDVCHGPTLMGDGSPQPLRVHALIDDHSRYGVIIRACTNEQESEMLGLMLSAVRRWGAPEVLYLDNGSTYRGEALKTACARMKIALLHPQAHDPQARGKIERFWRTVRENVLDHIGREMTLAEVQDRLDRFLEHYNQRAHSSLDGITPTQVWSERRTHLQSETALATAMTIRQRRRVSRDGVVSIDGEPFEVLQRFLAGRLIDISSCLVPGLPRVVRAHYDGRDFELKPLDAAANGATRRRATKSAETKTTPLDAFAPRTTR